MVREKLKPDEVRKFSDWYDEHKDELNKQKKERYDNDPEYREAVRSASRLKYQKKIGILPNNLRLIRWKGKQHVAYKVSDAAELLDININTLRSYINKGYLPNFLPDGSSLRVITVDQMLLVKEFLERVEGEPIQEAVDSMKSYLLKNWRNRDGSKEIINKGKGR